MPKVLQPIRIITNGDMSANVTSMVVDGRYLTNLKFQGIWTGNATGTFSLQESLNYDPISGSGTWRDNGAGIADAAGVANDFFVNLLDRGPCFYRLVFTNTGGTGTLNSYASGSGSK